jgi:hypothetical protein
LAIDGTLRLAAQSVIDRKSFALAKAHIMQHQSPRPRSTSPHPAALPREGYLHATDVQLLAVRHAFARHIDRLFDDWRRRHTTTEQVAAEVKSMVDDLVIRLR